MNQESSSQPLMQVHPSPQSHMRGMMGPLMVDNAIRQAIQQCWMALPEDEKSTERVEQEILRLVQRALKDLKEDAAAFQFSPMPKQT